jgi:hypothetical protein
VRAQAAGATLNPSTTGAAFAVIPEMTVTMTTRVPEVWVSFNGTVEVLDGDDWDVAIFSDGVEVTGTRRNIDFFGGAIVGLAPARIDGFPAGLHALVTGLVSGAHTFDVRWKVNVGTARATGAERSIIAFEVL